MLIRTSKGFTLIELVVVIAIVGILAAFALPRFMDAQRDARRAKVQSLYGALRSASALAHARCVLDISGTSLTPACNATGGTVDMEGVSIAMLNQYPARNTVDAGSGIIAAAGIVPQADGVLVSVGTNPTTIDVVGALTAGECRISYTEAVPGLAPTITLTPTGC